MTTSQLLLRTPDPHPRESIQGYLLRVSEANHYDTPWHVLRHAGYSQDEMWKASFQVDKLAAVVGKDSSVLEQLTYVGCTADGQVEYRLSGQPLGLGLSGSPLQLRRPAICAKCIEEDGFANASWDLSLFVACPVHGGRLLERCANCGAALSWFRPGLLTCRCSADYRHMSVHSATPEVTVLMQIVDAAVHTSPGQLPQRGHVALLPMEALTAMPLKSLLRMIEILGKTKGRAADRRYDTVEVAAQALANWPLGFHAYLRRRAGEEGAEVSVVGLRSRFRGFYESMFKSNVRPQGVEFLREEFLRFGLEHWGESLVDGKLLRGDKMQGRFVSARRFAAAFGVMQHSVHQWVDEGALPAKIIQTGVRRHYVIDSALVGNSVRLPADRLQMRNAAKRIAIPVSALAELKRSGHYSPSAPVNRRPGFWVSDLEALSSSILATAEPLPAGRSPLQVASQEWVSLGEVLRKDKLGGFRAKGVLLAEILDGNVVPVGRLDGTITSIQLRACDIEAFRLRFGLGSDKTTVTAPVAAQMLGGSLSTVNVLIKAGHLLRHKGSRTGIQRDSVERFRQCWASAGALSKELGASAVDIAERAVALGLATLSAEVVGGRKAIFVARDAVPLLREDAARRSENRAPRYSPHEIRMAELAALGTYLADLRMRGKLVPVRGGKPNRSAIAKVCGFSRNAFYVNPELAALLDGDNHRKSVDAFESHRAALVRYCASLRADELELPMFCGKPNLSAIAMAAGIPRNAFYNFPDLATTLTSFAL